MKTCPKCGAQYDNDTLLFCTRDSTPVVPAENAPEFTDLPSESWPAEGREEDTVVLSKPVVPAGERGEKIVVPMGASEPVVPPPVDPSVRRYPPPLPPPKPRIGLTILVSVLSTIGVIALAVMLWWVINGSGGDKPANGNIDANLLNANYSDNYNANSFNMNTNFN